MNEDTWATERFPTGEVFLVADGMGGHRTGEVASSLATEGLLSAMRELAVKASPPDALARAFQRANMDVYRQAMRRAESRGMGTTLTSVFLDAQTAIVGHVGDSRAYLIRAGKIEQLTRDHSWVAERVRQGILSSEEAKTHRWRNVITNAMGSFPQLRLDLFGLEVQEGDTLLLCSDGLTNVLTDAAILEIVESHPHDSAVAVAQRMIDMANAGGAPDNVTAVLVRVQKVTPRKRNYALPNISKDMSATMPDPDFDVTHTMVLESGKPQMQLSWNWIIAGAVLLFVLALFVASRLG